MLFQQAKKAKAVRLFNLWMWILLHNLGNINWYGDTHNFFANHGHYKIFSAQRTSHFPRPLLVADEILWEPMEAPIFYLKITFELFSLINLSQNLWFVAKILRRSFHFNSNIKLSEGRLGVGVEASSYRETTFRDSGSAQNAPKKTKFVCKKGRELSQDNQDN